MPDPSNSAEYQAYINQKNKSQPGQSNQPSGVKPRDDPEHRMQCQIVDDFAEAEPYYSQLLHAIPNGAKLPYTHNKKGARYSPEAVKLLAEGMTPGIPDLHLPVARGGWHSLYIECKIAPNVLSDEQIAMMDRLTKEGNLCMVAWTREQGALILADYLTLQ